jgi:phage gpG-like protein
MSDNRLLDNLQIDINMSPELQRLISHNSEIGPQATKLGLRRVTKEGSAKIKERIKSLGLVDSGKLVKSVRGSTTKSKSFIGTKLFYAHFLEEGAKAHKIKPRKKGRNKGLYIKGKWVKSVMHPGVKAYHFFEDTWDQMESSGQVDSLFALGVQQALEEVQNGG